MIPRQPLSLSGTLTQGTARRAVPHAALTVYRRVGTGPWTAVRRLTTSTTDGRYRTTLRPVRTAVYRVAYVGSNSRLASSSPVRTVAVR